MPSEEVFREFIMLLMDVNNHTRMVSNRGFTPLEMAERMPHAPKGTRPTIVPMSSMAADLLRESQEELSRMGIHADPDDWVEPEMLEELYKKAKEDDADMVICDYYVNYRRRQIYKQQKPVSLDHDSFPTSVFSHSHPPHQKNTVL